MKCSKLLCLIFGLCILTACSDNQSKYVRNILFDNDGQFKISVEYYDFSSEDENFKIIEIVGDDLTKLCMTLQQQYNFNYRLCENIFATPSVLEKDLNLVFYTVGSLQIPAAVNLHCFLGTQIPEWLKEEFINTNLYNFTSSGGNIDGIIAVYDEDSVYNGAVIISSGKLIKYIPENQWKVLSIITGDSSEFSLKFREGQMYAKLEKCNAYFYGMDEINLNITINLKESKGISDATSSKKILVDFLKSEITDNVYRLYSDLLIADFCNLYWYANNNNISKDKINVKVNVI